MLRYLTAGESHGPCLTAIIEGMPAGIAIQAEKIDQFLQRRQGGYGRGKRMAIECDRIQILSGVRNGFTLGSPVALQIINKDWENWKDIMNPLPGASMSERVVTKPRPGHADLPGAIKYGHEDMRNILERASARETAIRTAVGAFASALLDRHGIWTLASVVQIGDVVAKPDASGSPPAPAYDNPVYCRDEAASQAMIQAIDRAKAQGDSLGGVFEVIVGNLPIGLGSHVHWDRRLDTRIAAALMGIPGIKGVEFGLGFGAAGLPGSQVHDEIFYTEERGFFRKTNRAGGVEGGMSNGEWLVVRAAMKPIPTLYQPLHSVDYLTKEPFVASVERSDTCAVPAASVVGESVVAWEIARALLEDFSGKVTP